jgi:negative regulator of sigma E activity
MTPKVIFDKISMGLKKGDSMIKRFMSRVDLFGVIFIIAVMLFSVSVNAADITADMIHKSSMGSFKGKMYLKGDNIRQEMNISGEKQITIFRKDKGVVWILMPGQMMYMEMMAGSHKNMAPVDPDELEKIGKKKFIGKETVNGYMCSKYEVTFNDPSMGAATYWISEKLNFPVKMEMNGRSGSMVMEYRNIQEKTVPDTFFNIPSGYQKMSMPIMPGMQGQ